jgi:hypothetical protein
MTQHTPGPWTHSQWGQTISINADGFTGIANINPSGNHKSGIPKPEDRANARLIAAAPDLLETAKLALADLQESEKRNGYQNFKSGELLRAAIAKAEGH